MCVRSIARGLSSLLTESCGHADFEVIERTKKFVRDIYNDGHSSNENLCDSRRRYQLQTIFEPNDFWRTSKRRYLRVESNAHQLSTTLDTFCNNG